MKHFVLVKTGRVSLTWTIKYTYIFLEKMIKRNSANITINRELRLHDDEYFLIRTEQVEEIMSYQF